MAVPAEQVTEQAKELERLGFSTRMVAELLGVSFSHAYRCLHGYSKSNRFLMRVDELIAQHKNLLEIQN